MGRSSFMAGSSPESLESPEYHCLSLTFSFSCSELAAIRLDTELKATDGNHMKLTLASKPVLDTRSIMRMSPKSRTAKQGFVLYFTARLLHSVQFRE